MTRENPADVMFPATVRKQQSDRGSRGAYERMEARGAFQNTVTPELADFLKSRDSFYLATAGEDGQPYIQHRGGEAGFLKIVDDHTLGFADFSGNKQYISVGNLTANDRAFIFLMDYPNRRRIKIWGRMRVVENDPDLLEQLRDDGYGGRPERAMLFSIAAWDANCPQHITPRYSAAEIADILKPYKRRIRELEHRLLAD